MTHYGVNKWHDHFFNLGLKIEETTAKAKFNELIEKVASRDVRFAHTEKQKQTLGLFLLNAIYYQYGNLIMSLASGGYNAKTRYNPSNLGSCAIRGIYKKLKDFDLIEIVYAAEAKPYNPRATVIKPTVILKLLCSSYQNYILNYILDCNDYVELHQTYFQGETRRYCKLEYLDNAFSYNVSAFTKDYNIWLRHADIICAPPLQEIQHWAKDDPATEERWYHSGRSVDLFRIFNFPREENYTETQVLPYRGGRFYRAFWITLPCKVRRFIKINGEDTVEIDFRAMNPCLMYLMQTKQPWAEYPYENVPLPNDSGLNFPKSIMKSFFTWCINRPTRKKAIETLSKKLAAEDKRFLELHGLTAHSIVDAALAKHPAIAPCFFQIPPLGGQLQFDDSQIMQGIMSECKSRDIVCLPMHDGCIVPASVMNQVKEIMISELTRYFNIPYDESYKDRLLSLEYDYEPELIELD